MKATLDQIRTWLNDPVTQELRLIFTEERDRYRKRLETVKPDELRDIQAEVRALTRFIDRAFDTGKIKQLNAKGAVL